MRIALVTVFLAASAFAQVATLACGPDDMDFEIKLDKSQHALTQPEPGKARVYFIQDIGHISCIGTCVKTKIGVMAHGLERFATTPICQFPWSLVSTICAQTQDRG